MISEAPKYSPEDANKESIEATTYRGLGEAPEIKRIEATTQEIKENISENQENEPTEVRKTLKATFFPLSATFFLYQRCFFFFGNVFSLSATFFPLSATFFLYQRRFLLFGQRFFNFILDRKC